MKFKQDELCNLIVKLIIELENEKIKKDVLIDKLKKANEEDQESVKRYENMRRNCEDTFYKKSYQASIHKLNAKRETREQIIDMMEE